MQDISEGWQENKICTYISFQNFASCQHFEIFLLNSENSPHFLPTEGEFRLKMLVQFSLWVFVYFVFHKVEMLFLWDSHLRSLVLSTDRSNLVYQRTWCKHPVQLSLWNQSLKHWHDLTVKMTQLSWKLFHFFFRSSLGVYLRLHFHSSIMLRWN